MADETRHSDGLMEVADVAAYTRLSESAIRQRVAAGTIPVVRIGRRTLFRRAEIDAWIDSHREQGSPTENVA